MCRYGQVQYSGGVKPFTLRLGVDIDRYNKVEGLNRLHYVSVNVLHNLLSLQILLESLDDKLLFIPRGRQILIISNKKVKIVFTLFHWGVNYVTPF